MHRIRAPTSPNEETSSTSSAIALLSNKYCETDDYTLQVIIVGTYLLAEIEDYNQNQPQQQQHKLTTIHTNNIELANGLTYHN